jgi:hypothetical protein
MADSSARVSRCWGLNGTARVLIEYTETANFKHVLLEPVDVKKDSYGFVYAPTRNAHGLIIPSETRLPIEDNPSPEADRGTSFRLKGKDTRSSWGSAQGTRIEDKESSHCGADNIRATM